jgi:hypothetical protein
MPYQEVFDKQYKQKRLLSAISILEHHALNYEQLQYLLTYLHRLVSYMNIYMFLTLLHY